MIKANELRTKREDAFKQSFDFASFDKYLEEFFSNSSHTHLGIGVSNDYFVKRWAEKNGRKCTTLSFIKDNSNYIWHTSIQVAQSIEDFVTAYLVDCGFQHYKKGACGYDHCNVIVVSL